MTAVDQLDGCADPEVVMRTAACLGALGYSPHEVHAIVAAELDLDPWIVAQMLRLVSAGSVPIVA